MKTKVWIVIWGLKDGGAEVLGRIYADMVDKEKFEPTIVTMYPFENTANFRHTKEAGLRVLSVFNHRNSITRIVRLLFGKWYIPFALKRLLKKEKPDAIHFNSQMGECFEALSSDLSGIRLFYTCHSEAKKYFSADEKKAVQKLVDSNDLRLIALHDDMRSELNRMFSTKNTVVVRNGVDQQKYCRVYDRFEIRHSLGIDTDAYVVGHIGRFSSVKNHMFLLEVFQEILSVRPEAHLLLVGSGATKDQVKQTISQQNLQGHVTMVSHRTDIPQLLCAMDVMVFPSLFEGLSVTLVEAQASGLKCVISDTINSANILSERTFSVSLNASAKDWADIALNDRIINENFGHIEDYDMNREIHRLERLYQGEADV